MLIIANMIMHASYMNDFILHKIIKFLDAIIGLLYKIISFLHKMITFSKKGGINSHKTLVFHTSHMPR